jgi:hypothetical protein
MYRRGEKPVVGYLQGGGRRGGAAAVSFELLVLRRSDEE